MSFPKHLNIGVCIGTELVKINSTYTAVRVFRDDIGIGLTEVFSRKLGFSYTLKSARDGEIGRLLPNGSWTGLIGMLLKREIDAVISILSISEQRQKVVDFSYPFAISRVTFATRKPEYTPDITTFYKPFSPMVWWLIAITFLLTTASFYALFQRKRPLKNIILYLFCIMLNQSVKFNPKKPREYIILLFWTLSAMVLAYSYTGALLSFLTFPTLKGVRTIPELATAFLEGRYTCETHRGSFFSMVLLNSVDSNTKTLGECLLRSKGSPDIDGLLDDHTSNMKAVYISGNAVLEPYSRKYFVSEDTIFSIFLAIPMRKDFCCRNHFDEVISYIWAGGIQQKIENDFKFKKSLKFPPDTTSDVERPLTLDDLAGLFIMLITGYCFSIAALLLEIVIKRIQLIYYLN